MPIDRHHLKTGLCAMLDALATEHPLKHQNAKARRYLLKTKTVNQIELMYEQGAKSPANIWILASHASSISPLRVRQTASPAADLYSETGKDGHLLYGHHSALKIMPMLGAADLVSFRPETLSEAGELIDQLLVV